MGYQRKTKRLLSGLLLIVLFITIIPQTYIVYADNLRYYDYSTKSNVNYTGKQVKYYLNNLNLSMTYPGIIIDGIALADYQELFVNELGLQAEVSGNTVTFTDGTTIVRLMVGSTQAVVNNKTKNMSIAPIRVKFDDGINRILVPSRFVAENFGYTYVWTSSNSTVKITKTLHLTIGNKDIAYNGSFYSLKVNDKEIVMDMPVFYYQGAVLAPLKNVCEALGCQYKSEEQEFQISFHDISLNFKLDEKSLYINDKKYVMDIAPVLIKDKDTNRAQVYISLEFLADVLGYELTYNDGLKQYMLEESTTEETEFLETLLDSLSPVKPEPQLEPVKQYFEWVETESLESINPQFKHISKISSYALEKADVLELYGITSKDINAFTDQGILIFDIKGAISKIDRQFYSEYSNPYLQYTLFTKLSSGAKLLFILPENTYWTFVDQDGYVQVFFAEEEQVVENLLLSSASAMETGYPDDCIAIPLPSGFEAAMITDQDNYAERNFQIRLSGNYLDYYQTASIVNPYYAVQEYNVSYDKTSNCTILTFYTEHICAYQYEIENNYLFVRVARPNELYSKIVLLDAGHGGYDPGAIWGDYKEKDLNFKIINTYVKELFETSDIKVYFTRETDVKINLYDRAELASEIGADLFISLHMNTNNNTSVNGTEVFYSASNNTKIGSGLTSAILARSLADSVSTALGSRNRGATKSDFIVVKYNTVPAVLIETGFMTNSNELAKLTDAGYQKNIAQAIYNTVEQIFKNYPTGR